jgi:hypothetical protein
LFRGKRLATKRSASTCSSFGSGEGASEVIVRT